MNTSPHDFREAYQANAIETTLPPGNDNEMEVELASPWARMGAYLINSLLSVVVVLPFIIAAWPQLMAELSGQSINADNINPGGIFISLAISMLLGLILLVWQIVWMVQRGQSIGKRLLGIKVIGLNGENPGFVGTVLLREVVYYLIVLVITFILGAILGAVMAVGGALDAIEQYSYVFDLLGYIPTIICTIMLFRSQALRRTLQDYLAKTLVVKA
ncbi:RDD family protein [Paralysiella testudinis]|uniref:RDD family protein n=1 Tax=Paralysiella testudinis TaxID=2809020 RepID=A0A892ZDL7_9NEIS|nr:RDD family protein [Paralysiella testudinis]QRQ81435.1 RDD family protein [Paralysiella testudinis]